ncbi:MAG: DUF4440 domain-containing protein, partial [Verrucomicrobia bacterium]|nr:DUF4440 domain-containing protein [Verrucomicrobiota bacterium]
VKAFLAFLADDAIELPDGGKPVLGKAAISANLKRLDEHGTTLDWHPTRAEAAVSGDLGYTFGTWELRLKNRTEPLAAGNYTTVWKKTADGLWKVVLDIGNQSKRGPD